MKHLYKFGKKKLFPICRSLTGKGNQKTLLYIKKYIGNLNLLKFKSGNKVFDWTVPKEWNVKDAYILDKYNNKIIDFKKNNLHLVGYSMPINKILSKLELLKHIHSIRKQPNAIPYVTSYYKNYWGFCVTDKKKQEIENKYKRKDKFRVVINSNFNKNGKMLIGELLIKGKSNQEIFISTYICHPSLANDNLSGTLVSLKLIKYFKKIKSLEKSIRFVFLPETIGAISYLTKRLDNLKKNVIGGYNLTCVGDEGGYGYISTKYNNSPSDEALRKTLSRLSLNLKKFSFLERGSDERQYNSPGVDLPITTFFRSKFGKFKEYHTSLDDFNFITVKGLNDSFKIIKKSINTILKNKYPKSKILCEPFMSKRGMYPTISIKNNTNLNKNLLNFLQYSDGFNSIEKISKLIKLNLRETNNCSKLLYKHKLIDY